MVHELGVFDVKRDETVPEEASWVFAISPAYGDPNLLENPGFELGFQGWYPYTPPDTTPLQVDTPPGYVGNSAVMVSDELIYKGGLRQDFRDVPPNTTFRFKVIVKTIDVENLKATILHCDIFVGGEYRESHNWGDIRGSQDWALYEISFTTPSDGKARVSIYPALVYNRGEVWIDEASLTIEGLQPSPTSAILNWYKLHNPFRPAFNPFVTESDLKYVEQGLKTVPTENFWGIIFIAEEHYRIHVEFNDTVNTTWFGESMLGYPLYLAESPSATVNQWKDEMFLRMIRGFHNYFSPLTKVGITANGASTVLGWKNLSWARGIPYFFGEPAMAFIREHYDFVIPYAYTANLEEFTNWTRQYFELIDQLFTKQKKLWILTRIFGEKPDWEPEAIALEMKNCFDRNMAVISYYRTIPPLEEVWPLMLRARTLYNARAPYTESLVYDVNLLTGYTNETYGWVANPEHDEGLYPTPISAFSLDAALALGGLTWATTRNPSMAAVAALIGGLLKEKT